MVADYVEIRLDQCYWNPVFIRAEQDWEADLVTQLLEDLYINKICPGNEVCVDPFAN